MRTLNGVPIEVPDALASAGLDYSYPVLLNDRVHLALLSDNREDGSMLIHMSHESLGDVIELLRLS